MRLPIQAKPVDRSNTTASRQDDSGIPADGIVAAGGIPIYGNWCGPGHGGGRTVDNLDACCKVHDKCYGTRGYFSCKCDRALVRCVAPKRSFSSRKGRTAWAVWTWFKYAQPCR